MKRYLLALSLIVAAAGLSRAFPAGDFAHIITKKKTQSFHDSVALFSQKPVEKSKIDGPQDLPVLALYFFRGHLSPEEKRTFAAAIAANTHGTGAEYPYAVLELGLLAEPPLRPQSVHVFNVGRCLSERSYAVTGAMIDYPDQLDQWNVKFTTLTGELKEGATIQYDVSLEHKASRYLAEFRGSAPLLVVASLRYQAFP
jgi:hypothetical protein